MRTGPSLGAGAGFCFLSHLGVLVSLNVRSAQDPLTWALTTSTGQGRAVL